MKLGCWMAIGCAVFSLIVGIIAIYWYSVLNGLSLSPADILFLGIWVPMISFMSQIFYIVVTYWVNQLDVVDFSKKWPAWLANAGSPDNKKEGD